METAQPATPLAVDPPLRILGWTSPRNSADSPTPSTKWQDAARSSWRGRPPATGRRCSQGVAASVTLSGGPGNSTNTSGFAAFHA
jgi:hypothetical protein